MAETNPHTRCETWRQLQHAVGWSRWEDSGAEYGKQTGEIEFRSSLKKSNPKPFSSPLFTLSGLVQLYILIGFLHALCTEGLLNASEKPGPT